MKSLAATERVCRLSLAPKAVTEMKPLVAVPLLLIADIIGSADQMPTDRSLNRVKNLSRSRFGQQTLHKAKGAISLLASRENTTYSTNQSRLPQGGGALTR